MMSGLIINADDWGFDKATTDAAHQCFKKRRISSASAMVWMRDSARASSIALSDGLDVGLHLNFTTEPDDVSAPKSLLGDFRRVSLFLRTNKYSSVLFNPLLVSSFKRICEAQFEEYERLYKKPVKRLDGHHHMHLCTNVLLSDLYPRGVIVRRSFTFSRGEKSRLNQVYRSLVDGRLRDKWKTVDQFYALPPMNPLRISKIVRIAQDALVELESHPVRSDEKSFLLGDEFGHMLDSNGVSVEREFGLKVPEEG